MVKKLLQLPLPELSVCVGGGREGERHCAEPWVYTILLSESLTTVLLRQILSPLFFSTSTMERLER